MAVQASHAAQARHTRGVLRRQAAILLTVVAVLTGTLNYATPAQAVTIPSNPDRIREPVVAGSKVNTPTWFVHGRSRPHSTQHLFPHHAIPKSHAMVRHREALCTHVCTHSRRHVNTR